MVMTMASTDTAAWAELFGSYPVDVLAMLVHSLMEFTDMRVDSIWKEPSFIMVVVAVYWARDIFIVTATKVFNTSVLGLIFSPLIQETDLQSAPLLYFVLAVQPRITILAFALITVLRTYR